MRVIATGSFAGSIRWAYRWYDPWQDAGRRIQRELNAGASLPEALNRTARLPVRFVGYGDLPTGIAYEQYVHDSGSCPTREGLHDFFNGLCWTRFPNTKSRLNQLQAAQIARDGIRPTRGPVRDALTLLDENAAFLHAPEILWAALAERQWRRLFVDLRPMWREARLVLFGHALLEKLQSPRKQVTAHVYRVEPWGHSLAELDAWVARDLRPEKLAGKPFAPMPVLGVPGWWPPNEDARFYDDETVFRPPATATVPMQ